MTGRAQAAAFGLALLATLLALAPIDLQRRMIDDGITAGNLDVLLVVGLIYLAAVVGQQAVKFALALLRNWLAESATLHVRRHLWSLRGAKLNGTPEGRSAVTILTAEAEALCGFAGSAPSKAFADAAMLIGALAYMFAVDPGVALVGLCLLLPQALLAPLMQRRLNRLVALRLRLMRRYAASLTDEPPPDRTRTRQRTWRLYRARFAFVIWKEAMKATMNLLNAAAPLAVIGFGGAMAVTGETTVGVVVAFVGGFAKLGDPARQLIAFYREAQEANVRHRLIADWMTPPRA